MIVKCVICGKKFEGYTKRYKYCPDCKTIKLTCLECGKTFNTKRFNRETKYCSIKCANDANRGPKNKLYKKVKRVCKVCNKVFYVSPNKLKYSKCDFCSKKCVYESKRTLKVKKFVCKYCGKQFKSKYPNRKYCSYICAGKGRNKNKPLIIKKLSTGYTSEFNHKLKLFIKKRDNFTCQLCFGEYRDILHIHHIDYDKTNNQKNNLISLCHSCHAKTISKRKFWTNLFSNYMVEWYGDGCFIL